MFINGIKLARMKAGLRQIDVAKAAGIAESTLSHYETGRTKPSPAVLKKLVEILGATENELLRNYELREVEEKCGP